MEAKEFNDLASGLACKNTAASIRSAISRSYYSAYHFVLDFLNNYGVKISRNSSGHYTAERYLSCSDIDRIKEAGINRNRFEEAFR